MNYRVWHKKFKKWIHDELDIFINPNGEVIERYDYSYESYMRDISNDVEFSFYSGMNDGNGKEIFEGDIIEIGHTSPPYLETVVFREGCFETAEECDNICHVKRNDFIAVVGNVHQHDIGLYGVTLK